MKQLPIKRIDDAQTICWLAGLLEGEGTFLSMTDRPASLALVMTDEDVVKRAAESMGSRYSRMEPRQSHHKVTYHLRVSGKRAAYYMRLILPHMGRRRAEKIRACLELVDKSIELHRKRGKLLSEKINDTELMEKWNSRQPGISFRAFARALGITSRSSLVSRIAKLSQNPVFENDVSKTSGDFDKISWLAGLLEGEGSFHRRGHSVEVALKMADEDVVARAAALLGRSYFSIRPEKSHWKKLYVVTVNGLRCVELLKKIRPSMGLRRQSKIDELITFYEGRSAALEASHAIKRHDEFQRWIHREEGESLLAVARSLGIKGSTYRARLVKAGLYKAKKSVENLNSSGK